MLRSQRLEPVRGFTSSVETRAAQALAKAEASLAQASAKLAELERYEREYRQALQERTAAGIGVGEMRSYQAFISKLGEAVAQQGSIVSRAAEECTVLRQRWVEATQRSRAVGKVIEHAVEDERRTSERKEQTESDERASRAFGAALRADHDQPPAGRRREE